MLTYKEIRVKVEMPLSIVRHVDIADSINSKVEIQQEMKLKVDFTEQITLKMNAVSFEGADNE